MPTDIVLATQKPNLLTSGLVTASSSTFDASVPTATIPSTTSQTFLLPTNIGDSPTFLRVVPFHSANNATSPQVRVIGWTQYTQTNGTPIYVPTLLANLACAYNATSGSIPSLSVNGTTQHFFHQVTVSGGVPSVNVYSPGTAAAAGTPPAAAVIDTFGSQLVTFQFASSTGTMGAFWTVL